MRVFFASSGKQYLKYCSDPQVASVAFEPFPDNLTDDQKKTAKESCLARTAYLDHTPGFGYVMPFVKWALIQTVRDGISLSCEFPEIYWLEYALLNPELNEQAKKRLIAFTALLHAGQQAMLHSQPIERPNVESQLGEQTVSVKEIVDMLRTLFSILFMRKFDIFL
ncbi:MAG: blastp no hit [Candidatus Improbicoccus devescovinae]|nr:MAG: blastp no hit [Candidatus Improbicoccus devescovinae]